MWRHEYRHALQRLIALIMLEALPHGARECIGARSHMNINTQTTQTCKRNSAMMVEAFDTRQSDNARLYVA